MLLRTFYGKINYENHWTCFRWQIIVLLQPVTVKISVTSLKNCLVCPHLSPSLLKMKKTIHPVNWKRIKVLICLSVDITELYLSQLIMIVILPKYVLRFASINAGKLLEAVDNSLFLQDISNLPDTMNKNQSIVHFDQINDDVPKSGMFSYLVKTTKQYWMVIDCHFEFVLRNMTFIPITCLVFMSYFYFKKFNQNLLYTLPTLVKNFDSLRFDIASEIFAKHSMIKVSLFTNGFV